MQQDFSNAPDAEWTDGETGQVYESVGRLVITPSMLAMEDLWSREFDREAAGEPVDVKPHSDQLAPKRGTISEFTRASQVRMMKACSSWRPVGRLMFVTLTYPKTFPDAAEAKEDLKRFRDILRREHPRMAGVWKLEYQTRGAPHFHFILQTGEQFFMSRELRAFQLWCHSAWRRARRSKVDVRTEAKFADLESRARFYLAKEVGKTAQTSSAWRQEMEKEISHEGGGRFWGWHHRSNIDRQQEEYAVPAEIAFKIRGFLQNEVLKSMQLRARIRAGKRVPYLQFKEGEWLLPNGKAIEGDKLPAWHLFEDAAPVFDRMVAWLRSDHGIDFFKVARRVQASWARYEEPGAPLPVDDD